MTKMLTNKLLTNKKNFGFTLVELLVVISIIGLLIGLSVFGLTGARETARDSKRKSDLEQIRSGIEIYKSDCNDYPAALSTSVVGDGTPTSCAVTNTYISSVPLDPLDPARTYSYTRSTTTTYVLCASLEQDPVPAMDTTGCGSCTTTCNYKVENP
jgi:type II secretion system protein G